MIINCPDCQPPSPLSIIANYRVLILLKGGDLLCLYIVEEKEVMYGIGVLIVVDGLNQIMIKVLLNLIGNFVMSVKKKPEKELVESYNIKIKLLIIYFLKTLRIY